MGIRVLEAGPDRVRIEAPLAPNLNHRATAFGGSVAALAILAGWALVHTRLEQEGRRARTVIQSSALEYAAPIDGAFTAVSEAPAEAAWERFTRTLSRRGRGRILVTVTVEAGGATAATFSGEYVAIAGDEPKRG